MLNSEGIKICKNLQCGSFGPFGNRSGGKLQAYCKKCQKQQRHESNMTPIGRAYTAWINITRRALNKDGKHPTYTNVENRLDKDWFIAWYISNVQNGWKLIPDYNRQLIELTAKDTMKKVI